MVIADELGIKEQHVFNNVGYVESVHVQVVIIVLLTTMFVAFNVDKYILLTLLMFPNE